MKDKIKLIYCIIFMTICIIPICVYPFAKNTKQIGNSKISSVPSLLKDGEINTGFSTEFEKFVNDTMPFRAEMLTTANYIEGDIFGAKTANVITGKNGWLFFAKTLDDYKGINQLSDKELQAISLTLSLIEEQVENNGGYFVFAPVPNKNSVYPEYMPEKYTKGTDSSLNRLYSQLDKYNIRYVDILSELEKQKSLALLYHKKDTHWNSLGALVGYNCITNKLEKNHDNYGNTEFILVKNWRGDLDELIHPVIFDFDYQYYNNYKMSDFEFTYPASSQSTEELLTEFMGATEAKDLKIVSEKSEKTDNSKLYMVRDSFGRALLPYMIEAYDEAIFVRTDCPEVATLTEGTDFVYEIAQRNLRDIIRTAPFMYSPIRDENTDEIVPDLIKTKADDNNVAYVKDEGYAIRIYGTIAAENLSEDGRIFVKLKSKNNKDLAKDYLFEAFPIFEENLIEEKMSSEATGFSMMLDSNMVEKGEYKVFVISGKKSSDELAEIEVK